MEERAPDHQEEDLIVERLHDEILLYDRRSDEAHRLAPPAAEEFERLTVVRGLSRREAVRRIALAGAGAAAAGSLITSIAAPAPAHAQSACEPTIPNDDFCSDSCQCESGCCCFEGGGQPVCLEDGLCAAIEGACV